MSEAKFETVEQKASYGIGLQMGQQLAGSGLEGLNVESIAAGIATALVGEQPQIEIDQINEALQQMHSRAEEVRQEAAKVAAADGEAFLKDNALAQRSQYLSLVFSMRSLMQVLARSQLRKAKSAFTTMVS